MRIDIITVFPEMVEAGLDYSIVKRARERSLIQINVINLRDYTTDRHKTTDDVPYGGGGGMVMKIEPIGRALEAVVDAAVGARVALTDPRGRRFTQAMAREFAAEAQLVVICGHYEGVDERVRQMLVTDEVSIGDYVLTGGELPALVIVDAVTRLQEGALGDAEAPEKDSFTENLLEYPHYTRPAEYKGSRVPDILLCGHHAQIVRWRRWWQLKATKERRPDLLQGLELSAEDLKLMQEDEPAPPAVKKVHRAPDTSGD